MVELQEHFLPWEMLRRTWQGFLRPTTLLYNYKAKMLTCVDMYHRVKKCASFSQSFTCNTNLKCEFYAIKSFAPILSSGWKSNLDNTLIGNPMNQYEWHEIYCPIKCVSKRSQCFLKKETWRRYIIYDEEVVIMNMRL